MLNYTGPISNTISSNLIMTRCLKINKSIAHFTCTNNYVHYIITLEVLFVQHKGVKIQLTN